MKYKPIPTDSFSCPVWKRRLRSIRWRIFPFLIIVKDRHKICPVCGRRGERGAFYCMFHIPAVALVDFKKDRR